MKTILYVLALTVAFTSLAVGQMAQSPQKHETLRLGQGRHCPPTSWHWSLDHHLCESFR